MAAFLSHLAQVEGLAARTVRKNRTVLSALMSCAVAMEYIDTTPVMKVPPPIADHDDQVAPTVEETARLLRTAETTDPAFLT